MKRKFLKSILSVFILTLTISSTAFATEENIVEKSAVVTEDSSDIENPGIDDGDGNIQYIDAMNATRTDERSVQINLKATIPAGMVNCYMTIMNKETGVMYNAPLVAANNYVEHFYVEPGDYTVAELSFYDDNTNAYPFIIPEDFTVSEGEVKSFDLQLQDYDALQREIADKIADTNVDQICPICGEELTEDGRCINEKCSNYTPLDTVPVSVKTDVTSEYNVHYSGSNPTVALAVTGAEDVEQAVVVKVVKSGPFSECIIQYSTDDGATFSENVIVPLSGIVEIKHLKLYFYGDNLTEGEQFTFFIPNPDKTVTFPNSTDEALANHCKVLMTDERTYAYDLIKENGFEIFVQIVKGRSGDQLPIYKVSLDNGATWLDEMESEKAGSDYKLLIGNTGMYLLIDTSLSAGDTLHITVPSEKQTNYTAVVIIGIIVVTIIMIIYKFLAQKKTPNNAYEIHVYESNE